MERFGSPVVLALDTPDLDEARVWAAAAGSAVCMVKVGLELFSAHGPQAVRVLRADGHRVMLDLKLHDIPATVGRTVAALVPLGAELLTVHASGGGAMLRAAVQAAAGHARVTAVTVLTSLHRGDLDELGLGEAGAAAERLAGIALQAGCPALVCSPLEVARVRALAGPGVLLVCPGVRPAAPRREPGDDQARAAAPAAALAAGADLLVVGRPITAAHDPAAAAGAISAEALQAARGGVR